MSTRNNNSFEVLFHENCARHGCVVKYLKVLRKIGLTVDEEEQRLVKRRVLQICLELQDMKDCMLKVAKDIQSIEQLDDQDSLLTDPIVSNSLGWNICRNIYKDMVMFWAHMVEENTVDCKLLMKILAALDKLENDAENHGVAVLEKRSSSEMSFSQIMEQKPDTRSNSCHLKNIKH